MNAKQTAHIITVLNHRLRKWPGHQYKILTLIKDYSPTRPFVVQCMQGFDTNHEPHFFFSTTDDLIFHHGYELHTDNVQNRLMFHM